jgi:heavy metal sensor kinase
MKSIRLSLIFYFLVLLAATLGIVSVYVYETTRAALNERQAAVKRQKEDSYRLRENEEMKKLDDELFAQARAFASVALFRSNISFRHFRAQDQLNHLIGGLCPTPQLNFGHFALLRDTFQPPFTSSEGIGNLKSFDEKDIPPPHSDTQVTEYFQVNSYFRGPGGEARLTRWRSDSMGERSFPVDPGVLNKSTYSPPTFEDRELEPGHVVRLIAMELPVGLGPRFPPVRRSGPDRGQRLPPPPGARGPGDPPPDRGPRPPSMFYIQCASETTLRDEQIARLEEEKQRELAALDAESRDRLASLRNRLALAALGSFAAALVGGYFLVGLGLAPLRRLSEAVSRVSAKDFRLPFKEPHLPVELRPIVEKLSGTLELLKRAFAREKQAAADISHELRTPLAALLTTTDVALRKDRTPQEYRELLEDCRATGQQMNQLVERLMALARLDAGVDSLRPCDVDAARVAQQCVNMVKPLAEAHQIGLHFHHEGATELRADPEKLREILTNLLHNAIQYNRPHGEIDLRVARDNGHLCMEVRDTGIGIAAEAREQIFERFYRADPSRQADKLHAGLGLSIVKGYVDLMGGTITVQSKEGEGSTFRVELPAT